MRSDARKKAVEELRQKILALPPTDFCGHFSSDFNGNCMTCDREDKRRAELAAVLTAAADDLNQHAHTYADTLTPTEYAAADIALRGIGINLRDITNAAWHLALLDAAGRVRAAAIHEGAR